MTAPRQRGFSLVELMVAMTITLIVSAAIYGLLTSGSNAFRREPELADRQQNIRVAMDLIARDVYNAGAGLPPFSQVFTVTDPPTGACTGAQGLNGCGVMGTLGPAAAGDRAPGDGQDPLENTDVLELVAVDEQCPPQSMCSPTLPGTKADIVTRESVPRCLRLPGLVLLTDNSAFVIQPGQANTATSVCKDGSSERNGNLTLGLLSDNGTFRVPTGVIPSPAPEPKATPAVFLYPARVVRYRIGPGLDPAAPGMPALWRSESGRYDSSGQAVAEPGEAGFTASASPWEIVARGIEDLQVEYMPGDNLWHNQPPVSVTSPPNNWQTMVRQVRITLSARAAAPPNVAGQTAAGGGAPQALRGQLSTTVTPRAAFNELQMGSQIQ